MIQRDLLWTSGKVNPSGIRSIAFFIDKDDLVDIPEGYENPTSVEQQVSVEGDFVLKAGKFFKRIYTTQGKGKVEFESMGEDDVQMFKNKATLKYPDISDEALALAKGTMNANVIFVIGTRTSGVNKPKIAWSILGSKEYNTKVTPKGNSGDNPGSDKGLSVEIEAPDFMPLPKYLGEIILEDGVYDCATDTFTQAIVPALTISSVAKTDETVANANDGTITVTATGGVAPLNYSKDDGVTWQTSNNFTGLADASYPIKVKDAANTTVAYASNPVVIAAGL